MECNNNNHVDLLAVCQLKPVKAVIHTYVFVRWSNSDVESVSIILNRNC